MVKDKQVQLLRLKMAEGKTIEAAAAAADMSVRSAHNWKTYPFGKPRRDAVASRRVEGSARCRDQRAKASRARRSGFSSSRP